MTNVRPSELNYDKYSSDQYDRDIVNSIPFHREMHEFIGKFIETNQSSLEKCDVLDLGTGTGITAKFIQDIIPEARIDVIDFSEQMMVGAKKKLGEKNVRYLYGDYTLVDFDKKYDLVVSVIGIHHQDASGKKQLFKKIYSLLKPGGVFIFGDLVTYRDPKEAALNNARHYHHLVERSEDEKTLTEWAHHHMYLNDLSPIEDQEMWLEKIGFRVDRIFLKLNTALLICKKK